MSASSAVYRRPPPVVAMMDMTSDPADAAPNGPTTYLGLTDAQDVNGFWTKASLSSFLDASQISAIDNITGYDEPTKYTVTGLVMLKKYFRATQSEWMVSSRNAWRYIIQATGSRPGSRTLVNDIIGALGVTIRFGEIMV